MSMVEEVCFRHIFLDFFGTLFEQHDALSDLLQNEFRDLESAHVVLGKHGQYVVHEQLGHVVEARGLCCTDLLLLLLGLLLRLLLFILGNFAHGPSN